jgi:hypothetical protein
VSGSVSASVTTAPDAITDRGAMSEPAVTMIPVCSRDRSPMCTGAQASLPVSISTQCVSTWLRRPTSSAISPSSTWSEQST